MPVFLEPPACAMRTKQINGIQERPIDSIPLHLLSTIVAHTESLERFSWNLRKAHILLPSLYFFEPINGIDCATRIYSIKSLVYNNSTARRRLVKMCRFGYGSEIDQNNDRLSC
jgi:hypothetical protein